MGIGLLRAYRRVSDVAAFPAYAQFFLRSECGREYGAGLTEKLRLVRRIRRNVRRIASATGWLEHLLLVGRVLSLPRELKGDVIECGCFKGSSTSSLSLACRLTGRALIVCDSFEGLPEVAAHDVMHVSEQLGRFETYRKGDYSGALEEVRANIRANGDLSVCEFVKGYFQDTLPGLGRTAAMIFLDVDLHESLRACLLGLWARLSDYGYLYTHEAAQLDYVSLFFDREFWWKNFGCKPPGLIGAGSGLPVGIGEGCGLGYAQKLPEKPASPDDPRMRHFCGDPAQRS